MYQFSGVFPVFCHFGTVLKTSKVGKSTCSCICHFWKNIRFTLVSSLENKIFVSLRWAKMHFRPSREAARVKISHFCPPKADKNFVRERWNERKSYSCFSTYLCSYFLPVIRLPIYVLKFVSGVCTDSWNGAMFANNSFLILVSSVSTYLLHRWARTFLSFLRLQYE